MIINKFQNLPGVIFIDKQNNGSGRLLQEPLDNPIKIFSFWISEDFLGNSYADASISRQRYKRRYTL